MMKKLLGFLIFINMGYFVYQQFAVNGSLAQPSSASSIAAVNVEVGRDIRRQRPDSRAYAEILAATRPEMPFANVNPAQIESDLSEVRPLRRRGAVIATQDERVCSLIGPFSTRSAADIVMTQLREQGIAVRLSERETAAVPDYLVYVGPQPSRPAARRLMAQFQAQALEAHIISAGRLENALSLGVFTRQPLALALQQKLKERGFDAKIGPLNRKRRGYQVGAELPQRLRAELVDDGIAVRECAPA